MLATLSFTEWKRELTSELMKQTGGSYEDAIATVDDKGDEAWLFQYEEGLSAEDAVYEYLQAEDEDF